MIVFTIKKGYAMHLAYIEGILPNSIIKTVNINIIRIISK